MVIKHINLPYPDFKLFDIIEPEEFDANNHALADKIDETIDAVNDIGYSIDAGNIEARHIKLHPIAPFSDRNVQDYLNNLSGRIRSSQVGESGAKFVGSTLVPGLTGLTVQDQMISVSTELVKKADKTAVYTKAQVDALVAASSFSSVEVRSTDPVNPALGRIWIIG